MPPWRGTALTEGLTLMRQARHDPEIAAQMECERRDAQADYEAGKITGAARELYERLAWAKAKSAGASSKS